MGMSNQAQLIDTLQRKIDDAILPCLPQVKELILLDFPNHANVGDSAIYAGELAFFEKKLLAKPAIVSDWNRVPWEQIANSDKNDPIFLHGGGNFGDLWPQHQAFRESVLTRFPGRRVVQLPQTVHYSDPAMLERTARIIKAHGNFVLLVRDDVSYQVAKDNFHCEVQKCPDMAFYLGRLKAPSPPDHALLLLMRNDREKKADGTDGAVALPQGSIVTDWIDDNKTMKISAKAATAVKALIGHDLNEMAMRRDYFELLARKRLERGTRLLSSSKFIVTDRLHAHIISILLDIPQVVLDNSYGKVSRFINLWTSGFSKMTRADSLSGALDIYKAASAG